MKKHASILFLLTSTSLRAATYYANASRPDDSGDGLSWATAKKTIQAAVDATVDGDTVLVTNGVYNTGVTVTPGFSLNNRVVIAKDITVKSVNGAAATIIEGSGIEHFGLASAIRCVYMSAGSLDGFTLQKGVTLDNLVTLPNYSPENSGGGVCLVSATPGTEIRNCIIRNNKAPGGGGVSEGSARNCIIAQNTSYFGGGGFYAALNDCVVSNNSASSGGGVYRCAATNCLLVSNTAVNDGGGTCEGTFSSCTIVGNTAREGAGAFAGTLSNSIIVGNEYSGVEKNYYNGWCTSVFTYSCTAPLPPGTGNISADPLFVDTANGDFRLQQNSPCRDAGNNAFVKGESDLDGKPRILGETVDMGAFESGVATQTDGLIAYYPFNGNANDAVGANNGTVYSAVLASDRYGKAGRAYGFNGASSYINCGQLLSRYDVFSYSAWFSHTNLSAKLEDIIQKRRASSNDGALIGCFGSNVWTTLNRGMSNHGARGRPVVDTGWHHVAVTSDGTNLSIYSDGVFVERTVVPVGALYSSDDLWIGRGFSTDPDGGGVRAFSGYIDEVRVYNRALSSNEVLQVYNCNEVYTVTFDPQGGWVSATNKTVTFDAAYGTLPEPLRVGYTFAGWWTATNGVVFEVCSNSIVSLPSDHTLTAHWSANAYTVGFDANGGTVEPTNKVVTFDAAYGTLPVAARMGYAFGGWLNSEGEAVTEASRVTTGEDHTLHAVWLQQPPLFARRSPAGNPAALNEGASAGFSVTAGDNTDADAAGRGMSNIVWYVDGILKQETRTGAPNPISSAFTLKTDAATVQGAAFRDIEVKAVASDRQGGTTETAWTVRVNNVPVGQAITFPAQSVKVLGDPDFTPGATASSGLPVVYESSNETVARVEEGLVHIVGAGTAVLTASQSGNFDFKAAASVAQTLTVKVRLAAEVPEGGGTVTGAGLYLPGTRVALTARPSTGFTFLQWEDGSQLAARSLVMPDANMTVSAWFGVTADVPQPVLADPGPQRAMVGLPFTLPLDVTSESLPTVTVSGLPAGLRYASGTKSITGVPTVSVTNKVVTITAKNVNALAAVQTFLLTVEPLPLWAWGAFNGTADTEKLGAGSASMSVTAQGVISGKLTLRGTNFSFAAASYAGRDESGVFRLTTTASVGRVAWPLALAVGIPETMDQTGLVPVTLSRAEGDLRDVGLLTLYRNVWRDSGMAAVLTNRFTGYYTANLPGGAEYGSGYLTFTVDKAGGVKTTGKLADGTAVSLSGALILDEAGRTFAVIYTAPTTYKGGGLFGMAEFVSREDGPVVLLRLSAPFVWLNLNPQATDVYGEGFERELDLSGGWYDRLGNLYEYYRDKALLIDTDGAARVPEISVGTNRYASVWWNPQGIALKAVTNSLGVMTGLAAPKAGLPVKVGGVYDYANATNAVGLTIALTRATGIFKGAFKAWFDYAATHTPRNIAYEGVLTPVRQDTDDGVEGRGFFLWADKGSYLNAYDRLTPYRFNWSYDLLLLGEGDR